jgi:hypothetical protein
VRTHNLATFWPPTLQLPRGAECTLLDRASAHSSSHFFRVAHPPKRLIIQAVYLPQQVQCALGPKTCPIWIFFWKSLYQRVTPLGAHFGGWG